MLTVPDLLAATNAFLAKPAKMLIGGQWRDAASGETLPSIDPATGQTVGVFPAGDKVDANEAVSAARRAVPAWKRFSPHQRGRILNRAALLSSSTNLKAVRFPSRREKEITDLFLIFHQPTVF